MADVFCLFSPPLYKCPVALVLLISVQKYDVNGETGFFYLQAMKNKGVPFAYRGFCSSVKELTQNEVHELQLAAVKRQARKAGDLQSVAIHHNAVVPAAAPGILASGDLKNLEKVAEI